MRVAVCQMNSGPDVEDNLEVAATLVREASDEGADLASLPEYLEYLGSSARRPELARPVPGPVTERLSSIAQERGIWVLAGSVLERADDRVYDTSVLFDRTGEIAARYRKIHLFDVDLPDQPPFKESATISAGDRLVTHAVESTRLGLSICYDLRFPELFRGLTVQGSELLCVPSQFQYTTGTSHWHALLRARAIEDQCFVLAPAQWGPFGDPRSGRRSFGHSMVVDPWGRILVEAPEEGSGVWLADLDLGELRRLRRSFPVLQHRRLGATC